MYLRFLYALLPFARANVLLIVFNRTLLEAVITRAYYSYERGLNCGTGRQLSLLGV
jgi:hypothetical protein